jgi:Uma2 family endonuclease
VAVQDQRVETRTLTVEAFWEEYAGQPYELVHGKVVEVSPAAGESPEVGAIMVSHIVSFVMRNRLGKVTNAEGGYWLNEHTLRAPDVGFYTWEKDKLHTDRDKYRPFPPDLAVEVVSPSDRAEAVQEKVQLYLRAGTRQVWVVFPQNRTVTLHHADGSARTLSADDSLDGGDLLPGFTLPVADCFPPPRPEEPAGE